MKTADCDVAIVGAGVMGISTALKLGRAGMKVALFDRSAICRGASGVNAGTLTLHMVRPCLVPHAKRGREMWLDAQSWLGRSITVKPKPGLALAFDEDGEAELAIKAEKRNAAGADIMLVTAREARAIEPSLTQRARAATVSPGDATVVSYEFGRLALAALHHSGVVVHENTPVSAIHPEDAGFTIETDSGRTTATQVVLAGGARLQGMLGWFGVDVSIIVRVNQLSISARMQPFLGAVVTVADERLSLKQFPNGTVLVGGGWQGSGSVDSGHAEAIHDNLVANLRLAALCVPHLLDAQIVRTWFGWEAETTDGRPILGSIPGHNGAWAVGAVGSGFTSGPFVGSLLGELILGQQPSAEVFPLDRLVPRRRESRQS
jgi:glycine/D-amino acid oxidase-like deaminating enzyme